MDRLFWACACLLFALCSAVPCYDGATNNGDNCADVGIHWNWNTGHVVNGEEFAVLTSGIGSLAKTKGSHTVETLAEGHPFKIKFVHGWTSPNQVWVAHSIQGPLGYPMEIHPIMGKVKSRIAEVAAKVPANGYLFLVQCQNQLPFLHVDKSAADTVAAFKASDSSGNVVNICYSVKKAANMRDVAKWMKAKTTATPLPSGNNFKCEAMHMSVLQAIDKWQNDHIKKFVGKSDVTLASREAFLSTFTDAEAQAAAALCLHCQLSVWKFEDNKFSIHKLDWKTDWKLQKEKDVKQACKNCVSYAGKNIRSTFKDENKLSREEYQAGHGSSKFKYKGQQYRFDEGHDMFIVPPTVVEQAQQELANFIEEFMWRGPEHTGESPLLSNEVAEAQQLRSNE